MHRKIAKGLGLAGAALCLLSPASAMAADTGSATASGTVTGATALSLTPGTPTAPDVTLNGTDQKPTFQVPFTLEDSRGTGDGWNTTISATQFTTGGTTPRTLDTAATSMTALGVTAAAGTTTTAPSGNTITYPLALTAAATAPPTAKFYSAAKDSGMGSFTLTPTFEVKVPANAYAGVYSSTLTLAAVTGP